MSLGLEEAHTEPKNAQCDARILLGRNSGNDAYWQRKAVQCALVVQECNGKGQTRTKLEDDQILEFAKNRWPSLRK